MSDLILILTTMPDDDRAASLARPPGGSETYLNWASAAVGER